MNEIQYCRKESNIEIIYLQNFKTDLRNQLSTHIKTMWKDILENTGKHHKFKSRKQKETQNIFPWHTLIFPDVYMQHLDCFTGRSE